MQSEEIYAHADVLGLIGREGEPARLGADLAAEALRIGNAMPRLQAHEGRPGLGPDAEIGRVPEAHAQLWAGRRAIGDTRARQSIEDHHIVLEQLVAECE